MTTSPSDDGRGMLVLARKENQRVHIGADIIVEVLSVTNGVVRLGFIAPRTVEIDREEVRLRKEVERANGGGQ